MITAQIARVMKPISSLQFPEAAKSTAPHERLHHEANPTTSVSQSDRTDLTARGARARVAGDRPSFPGRSSAPITRGSCAAVLILRSVSRAKHQAAAQGSCTADPLFRPVSRANRRIRRTGRPHESSTLRRSGCPKRRVALHLHGLLELMAPTSYARLPERGSSAPLRAVRT